MGPLHCDFTLGAYAHAISFFGKLVTDNGNETRFMRSTSACSRIHFHRRDVRGVNLPPQRDR
jgi:hypothetical protein